jgi:hypothetical protein
MTGKEQYYFLDEIGFLGDQSRTKAQVKRDAKRTDDYFKALKAGKLNPEVRKAKGKIKSK